MSPLFSNICINLPWFCIHIPGELLRYLQFSIHFDSGSRKTRVYLPLSLFATAVKYLVEATLKISNVYTVGTVSTVDSTVHPDGRHDVVSRMWGPVYNDLCCCTEKAKFSFYILLPLQTMFILPKLNVWSPTPPTHATTCLKRPPWHAVASDRLHCLFNAAGQSGNMWLECGF